MDELRARVAILEREVRIFRVAALCLLLILVSGKFPPSSAAPVASKGAVLKAPLSVVDVRGKKIMEVLGEPAGAALKLYGSNGQPSLISDSNPLAGGRIFICNLKGTPIAAIFAHNRNGGFIDVRNSKGDLTVGLSGTLNGGEVGVYDTRVGTGSLVAGLLAHQAGGRVDVWNPAGKRTATMASSIVGGTVEVFDARDRVMGQLSYQPGSGKLSLMDDEEKTIFSAPPDH